MVRILARFELCRPCCAPLLVVAQSNIHAMLLLSGIHRVSRRVIHGWGNQALNPAQVSVCQQLCTQHVQSAPKEMVDAIAQSAKGNMPAHVQHAVEVGARLVASRLPTAFVSLKAFLELSAYSAFSYQ